MSTHPSHPLGASERANIGVPELNPVDTARESGVTLEQARRMWRALGFPPVPDDEIFFTRADVEMLRSAAALVAQHGGDLEPLLQLTRVAGQSLARVAETVVSMVAEDADAERQPTADEAAERILESIDEAAPNLLAFLTYAWRRHLLAAARRVAAAQQTLPEDGRLRAIGFADLVDFTAISQQLDDHELAALVDRFEAVAYDHIPQGGGRVIKMIGDEVMFSAENVEDGARIALDLVATYADDAATPEIRVGLAFGPTLAWQGDLFGPTVNLASRLVHLARPGSVLVSEEVFHRLEGSPRFTLRRLRRKKLKGIGKVGISILRAPAVDDATQSSSAAREEKAAVPGDRRPGRRTRLLAERRQQLQARLQGQLEEQLVRLGELKARATDRADALEDEAQDQIDALQAKADVLGARLEDLSEAGEDAWEKIRHGAESAWEDLADSVTRAWRKLGR